MHRLNGVFALPHRLSREAEDMANGLRFGEGGIIIDLGKYNGIEIDADHEKATLKGSILSRQVATALAEAGFFTGKTKISVPPRP